MSHADWSADGQSVVVSDTFLPPKEQSLPEQKLRPCVAVDDLVTGLLTCLEDERRDEKEEGWQLIYSAHFVSGNNGLVTVQHRNERGAATDVTFVRSGNGTWSPSTAAVKSASVDRSIDVAVLQDLNDSPVLVATDRRTTKSRIIWDPNPQLRDIEMAKVSVFQWRDTTGREWLGGLYKPPDYVQGKRYPLVIQTHGFDDQQFRPYGSFPTAFAAQELAAAGFLVLQVRDCPIRATPEEGPCQVAGYEAAVEQLSADDLVDPDRVGIIGFSRTCYYVLEALTTSNVRFQAASITDGVNEGYLQYILTVDLDSINSIARDGDTVIGARPFGTGLKQWLRRSPEFNMDKVTTPLLVVSLGRYSVLEMWEPYAALRYLNRPVDLIVLNSDEHVLTNPAIRLASQGGTVDWFRFWLKGEEDPDPNKAEQYARWRELRKLQEQNEKKSANAASPIPN